MGRLRRGCIGDDAALCLALGCAGSVPAGGRAARHYPRGVRRREIRRSDSPRLVDLVREAQQSVETAQCPARRPGHAGRRRTRRSGLQTTRRSRRCWPRLRPLAVDAGLTPMRGPGLVVTLTDAQRDANGRFPRDASPDDLVVHQQDIQAVLNALWSSGAEAVQMQDQRLIATSAPRCVGNTLLLNGRTYSPPYTITAIGDVAKMQAALAAAPLVTLYKQYVVRFGLGYTEEPRAAVDVVGYTEPVAMHYAQPPVTWHSACPGRRQLRQLRLQPGPVPGPAGVEATGVAQRRRSPRGPARAADDFDGVLLSPGPGTPERAGASIPLVRACAEDGHPLLGVCLGHQAIGVAFGATVDRAPELLHGKTSTVYHTNIGVLQGLPNPFVATRYHSLTVLPDTVPAELVPTAHTQSGVIMGVQHAELPIHGVQFHPESILTQGGHRMLANWLAICGSAPDEGLVSRLETEVADTVRAALIPTRRTSA